MVVNLHCTLNLGFFENCDDGKVGWTNPIWHVTIISRRDIMASAS